MDTLEKLKYIRKRIIETEKEYIKSAEKDIYNVKDIEDKLTELQNLYKAD